MDRKSVVVVTGGAKRVGRDIATYLASKGYQIVLHCNTSRNEAEQLKQDLEKNGAEVAVVQGDLTDLSQLETLFLRFIEPFGCVDALVNNASQFIPCTIEMLTLEAYRSDMALHADAPFFLAKYLYEHLKKRKARGAVVNLTDTKLSSPTPSRPSYYCSKGNLQEQTRVLAASLAPYVRVNAIAPGVVLSSGDDAYFAKMEQLLPLRRCGTPRDVSEAVLYLLCAEFVTGVTLEVDGGQHLL